MDEKTWHLLMYNEYYNQYYSFTTSRKVYINKIIANAHHMYKRNDLIGKIKDQNFLIIGEGDNLYKKSEIIKGFPEDFYKTYNINNKENFIGFFLKNSISIEGTHKKQILLRNKEIKIENIDIKPTEEAILFKNKVHNKNNKEVYDIFYDSLSYNDIFIIEKAYHETKNNIINYKNLEEKNKYEDI